MRKILMPKFGTFFDEIYYENWFFRTCIFLHFCKHFQFQTTYLSLQYLIFCVQMSEIYWILSRFDKLKTKPVVPCRISPIFYDKYFSSVHNISQGWCRVFKGTNLTLMLNFHKQSFKISKIWLRVTRYPWLFQNGITSITKLQRVQMNLPPVPLLLSCLSPLWDF